MNKSALTPRIPEDRARRYREAGWWRDETLDRLVLRHAAERAAADAIVAGGRRLTYADLSAAVDGASARLRALGLGRGSWVVVQLPNCVEFVVLLLALLRVGAVPVLVAASLREFELARVLELAEPQALAVPRRARRPSSAALLVLDPGEEPADDVFDLGRLCKPLTEPAAGADHGRPGPNASDTALVLMSSGTTGPLKLVARTHEDYGYVIRTTSRVAGLTADSVYLAVMPTAQTFALAHPGVLGTLSSGGTVVLDSPEDPRRVLGLIEAEHVTHAAAVPAMAARWLATLAADAAEGTAADVSSLRVLQVGGAGLEAEYARRAKSEFGVTVQQVYGMAEGLTSYTRLDDPDEVTFTSQGRPASPGDELLIVDESEKPVDPGEVGQLLTRGPFTAAGYHADPMSTRRGFTDDGFYRTGDLVRRRPDGNLEVVGRIKNVINRGGEKISAEDVEALVLELPEVAGAAVVPLPHPVHGETVLLYAVPAQGRELDLIDLRKRLESRGLARYKLPERLELLDALPVIGVGKVDRKTLSERAAALATGHGRHV